MSEERQGSPRREIWEQKVIKDILHEHVNEHRRKRRWSIFFKLIILGIIGLAIWQATAGSKLVKEKYAELEGEHIAKISINGPISSKSQASAKNIIGALNEAYSKPNVKAIVLDIDSPGGTPVEARRIYNEIRFLQDKVKDKKVYAVIANMGTSAAYLIASAANEIYADETSFVGSIGALVNGFGLVGALDNLGVERRLYVAGKHKGMLDPFSPETEEHKQFIQKSLDLVHQEFIKNVKDGRGAKLKNDPDMFSGRFWSGKEALGLGLIDGFGDIYTLKRNVIKLDKVIDYTKSGNFLDKLSKRVTSGMKSMLLENNLTIN